MRRIACIATLVAGLAAGHAAEGIDLDRVALVAGNHHLAGALYRELAATGEVNSCCSPYGVGEALRMVRSGARGRTAAEIAAAIGLAELPAERCDPAARRLRERLTAELGSVRLNIANGLCITGETPHQAYRDLLRRTYAAEIFSGGLDPINAWVSRQTEGEIERILERLSPNTCFVLLNAVYCKGQWAEVFAERDTRPEAFTPADGATVQVPFMHDTRRVRHLGGRELAAVELPYRGDRFAMVFALPAAGLAAWEEGLDAAWLTNLLAGLDRAAATKVELALPKFSLATSYDLIPVCRRLGMERVFSAEEADLSGMIGSGQGYWVSQVRHKACVEIDEQGAVAAAATAVEVATKSAAITAVPRFTLDRPFLFLIRDRRTGTVLFVGRVGDPGPAEE